MIIYMCTIPALPQKMPNILTHKRQITMHHFRIGPIVHKGSLSRTRNLSEYKNWWPIEDTNNVCDTCTQKVHHKHLFFHFIVSINHNVSFKISHAHQTWLYHYNVCAQIKMTLLWWAWASLKLNSTCTPSNASEVSPEQCKDQLYAGGHYIQVVAKSRFHDILSWIKGGSLKFILLNSMFPLQAQLHWHICRNDAFNMWDWAFSHFAFVPLATFSNTIHCEQARGNRIN